MEANIEDLNEIFRSVLDIPDLVINANTKAADIEEWDSLNHMLLVVAIEKRYKAKFTLQEIKGWEKVGDVIESLKTR